VARRYDPQQALAEALKQARKRSGLTQEALAERVQIDQARISQLESGSLNPTWSTLRALSAGLGMTLSELAAEAEAIERTDH
jgi:transcriptional regulator with XRE-family HTH domain